MKQSNGWYNKKAYTISYTHTDNQRDYLMYGTKLSKEKKTTAMLVDGPWWQTEAKAAFENMVKNGGNEYSANSRKFGWMPLPHADESKVVEKPVYSDYLKTFVCMKSGLGTRKRAAEEFIKFISTDEQIDGYAPRIQIRHRTVGYDRYVLLYEERNQLRQGRGRHIQILGRQIL